MVDPNTCGNYAVSDAGRKLKNFLIATQDLQKVTQETVEVVKTSCKMMGNELGMSEAEYTGETKDICAKVWQKYDENFKVALKSKAALKIKYKPAVCRVNVEAQAKAAAECEAKATADVKATCSGTCRGTCEGTCAGKAGTGGSGGQCNGQCNGTCKGECEGHADVNASAQCKASASVKASMDVQCTEPELDITLDAKLAVDKSKAEMVIRALKAGVPKLLSVKARLEPLKYAVEAWVASANELKGSARTIAMSFKDQATCISGQIAAAANMIGSIQMNVSVSVEVSASASGSIGG
jgi:modification target Cys-rich repeat protein